MALIQYTPYEIVCIIIIPHIYLLFKKFNSCFRLISLCGRHIITERDKPGLAEESCWQTCLSSEVFRTFILMMLPLMALLAFLASLSFMNCGDLHTVVYTVEPPNKGHCRANDLSLVERLSLSPRVPYWRFHCIGLQLRRVSPQTPTSQLLGKCKSTTLLEHTHRMYETPNHLRESNRARGGLSSFLLVLVFVFLPLLLPSFLLLYLAPPDGSGRGSSGCGERGVARVWDTLTESA